MVSRAERTQFAGWWWTVDRWLLAVFAIVAMLGIIFLMAASPAVAERLGRPTFFFVDHQVMLLVPAAILMVATSFLTPRDVRRVALVVYIGGMFLVICTLFFAVEIQGAKRWLWGIQPSEFVKPAFEVVAAWAFSEGARRHDVPANLLAMLLLPVTIIPLILEPDFGQTMLITLVWAALFFMAGLHWFWVGGIGGIGAAGVLIAYRFDDHIHARIQQFLYPNTATKSGLLDRFQIDTGHDAMVSGGWLGLGPGEGIVKRYLPDAHTDMIPSVIVEEFGFVALIAVVLLFAFILLRGLYLSSKNEDPFCRFAIAGLTLQFGIQSAINIAVNLQLMPAKGMTLPFISYGGSSLLSLGLSAGFLIALTRRRPRSEIHAGLSAHGGNA